MEKLILCCEIKRIKICPICGAEIESGEICAKCSNKLQQLNDYLKSHGCNKQLTMESVLALQKKLQSKDVFSTLFKIDFYPILLQLPKDSVFTETNTTQKAADKVAKHQKSKGERIVEEFLKSVGLPYCTQYKTLKCINPITGKQLPYDFEIPDFKVIVEVQGKQHYESVPYFHGKTTIKYQLFKDSFKRQFAIENGYKFVCIYPEDLDNNIYKQKIMKAIVSSVK